MDDETADFGIIRQYGMDEVATVYSNMPGKREPSQRKTAKTNYYGEVFTKIADYDLPTIVAGPGFTKEEFRKYAKDVHGKDILIESVSTTGRTGLYELVKKGLVERVYTDSKTAKDIQLVEELFSHIIKGNAAYGLEEVRKAIEYNACETLLVVDSLLRKSRDVESLLEKARQRGGETHIISSHHEGGEKLENLGGIAALLRFKIN
jgi:protein pelota